MLSSATSNLRSAYNATTEGGTVELETGTTFAPGGTQTCMIESNDWSAALCVEKAVKFQCLDTAAKCTLDGSSNKRVITVNSGTSATTELTGLIVTRGLATNSNERLGGGMYIYSSDVAISECDFSSNASVSIDEKKAAWWFTFDR
jgi:hypothetical protein